MGRPTRGALIEYLTAHSGRIAMAIRHFHPTCTEAMRTVYRNRYSQWWHQHKLKTGVQTKKYARRKPSARAKDSSRTDAAAVPSSLPPLPPSSPQAPAASVPSSTSSESESRRPPPDRRLATCSTVERLQWQMAELGADIRQAREEGDLRTAAQLNKQITEVGIRLDDARDRAARMGKVVDKTPAAILDRLQKLRPYIERAQRAQGARHL